MLRDLAGLASAIVPATSLVVIASLVLSGVYEWGFFTALGLSYLEYLGPADFVRRAISSIPLVALFVLTAGLLSTRLTRFGFESVRRDLKEARSQTIADGGGSRGAAENRTERVARARFTRIVLVILAILFACGWFLANAFSLIPLAVIFYVVLLHLLPSYGHPLSLFWLAEKGFALCAVMAFAFAYDDAAASIRSPVLDMRVSSSTLANEDVSLVRFLEQGALVFTKRRELVFIPWDDLQGLAGRAPDLSSAPVYRRLISPITR